MCRWKFTFLLLLEGVRSRSAWDAVFRLYGRTGTSQLKSIILGVLQIAR
jgi:hypothetical protein